MITTGCADPCPCGSGKNVKQCSLGQADARSAAFTREEREAARARLARLSTSQEFVHVRTDADADFWSDWLERHCEDELRRAMGLDESRIAFQEWFAFDYPLPGGSTIIELLLDREGDLLRTGEQRYLERMRSSHMRPYEVTEIRLDEGLDLRDLWTEQTIQVREKRATHELARRDVLVARIVLGEHGVPVIDSYSYLLPATAADPLLKRLRQEHRDFTRVFPEADIAEFFKDSARIPFHFWLDLVAFRPAPKTVSAERHELWSGKTIFEVLDAGALTAVLASQPSVDRQDDGSYVWFEEIDRAPKPRVRRSVMARSSQRWPPRGVTRRTLGTIVVEPGRLVLDTTSKELAQRGRRLLEKAAGPAIKFKATRYESVDRAIERAGARPRRPGATP